MSMKNQHKNIDEQLRDLESKSIPNLSHIDQHWKQMEGKGGVRIRFQKPLLWVASIVIITSTILILTRLSEPTKQSPESLTVNTVSDQGTDTVPALPKKRKTKMQSETSDPTDSLTFLSISDTVSKRKLPVKLYARKRIQPLNGSQNNLRRVTPKKVLLKAKTSTGVDTVFEAISVQEDSTAAIPPAQLLDEFFAQIATPSQTFTINNQYDTILVGRSGSLLFIPAGSFGEKKNVSIVLTEYYTKEEFIRNRLATMSGKQTLVSGGMVNVEAFENGRKIGIDSSFKIRWCLPARNVDLAGMELFEGVVSVSKSYDTQGLEVGEPMINWIPTQKPIIRKETTKTNKVVDIRNTPYKTKYRKGREIGYFLIAKDAAISKEQLADSLTAKFKYHKVYIKNEYSKIYSLRLNTYLETRRGDVESLGDSTIMDSTRMKFYKLTGIESIKEELVTVSYFEDSSDLQAKFNMPALESMVKDRHGVDLSRLGWINCDRFYKDPRPKTPIYIEIGDSAVNYYTTLVFKNLNATLRGRSQSQSVIFDNVPEGEEVIVVCVGALNGKIRSTVEQFVTGRNKMVLKGFKESSSEEFQEKLLSLDK